MRALKRFLLLLLAVWPGLAAQAGSGKVIKVLPQYLDREGRHSVSPSLYDRDAYQARLRRHPQDRSGMRFAIQWRGPRSTPLQLRVELRGARGSAPTTALLEAPVQYHGWFHSWSYLTLAGEDYQRFGELVAWRATLWDGSRQVAEQKSFLW